MFETLQPVVATLLLALLPVPATVQLDPDQVSRTAIAVACARAFMAQDPDPGTRNPDYLAGKLLDAELRRLVPDACSDLDRPFEEAYRDRLQGEAGFLTLGMVVRTKHIDQALEASLAEGVRQVVILGAGLDSRGYRMAEGKGVRFFEVDSPATQEAKKGRVRRLFGSLPSQVVYVPTDFETRSLEAALLSAGFDATSPAFFVWEGVTMYLSAEAVDATLRFVARHSATRSSIVFDYVLASVIDGTGPEPPATRAARIERLRRFGEPWRFGIPQGGAAAFVEQRGFNLVSDLGVQELFTRYVSREVPKGVIARLGVYRMVVARVRR